LVRAQRFGAWVQQYRTDHDWSQTDCADRVQEYLRNKNPDATFTRGGWSKIELSPDGRQPRRDRVLHVSIGLNLPLHVVEQAAGYGPSSVDLPSFNAMLGDQLKRCRKQADMSIEDVADIIGVGVTLVAAWETGSSIPDLYQAFAMSRLYGCSIDSFVTDATEQAVVRMRPTLKDELAQLRSELSAIRQLVQRE